MKNIDEIKNLSEIGRIWEKNGKKRLYIDSKFFSDYTGVTMDTPSKSSGWFHLYIDGEYQSNRKTAYWCELLGLQAKGKFLATSAFFDFEDKKIKAWSLACNGYNDLSEYFDLDILAKKIETLSA